MSIDNGNANNHARRLTYPFKLVVVFGINISPSSEDSAPKSITMAFTIRNIVSTARNGHFRINGLKKQQESP